MRFIADQHMTRTSSLAHSVHKYFFKVSRTSFVYFFFYYCRLFGDVGGRRLAEIELGGGDIPVPAVVWRESIFFSRLVHFPRGPVCPVRSSPGGKRAAQPQDRRCHSHADHTARFEHHAARMPGARLHVVNNRATVITINAHSAHVTYSVPPPPHTWVK